MHKIQLDSIKQLLQKNNEFLYGIQEKLSLLQRIHLWLLEYLDPELAKHCCVANIRIPTLILMADNASAATQIKLLSRHLLELCKKNPDLKDIKEILCKVRSPLRERPSNTLPKPSLSIKSAEHILSTAE